MSNAFYMFGEFNEERAQEFCEWIHNKNSETSKVLYVYINSYGGYCSALWSMLDAMNTTHHSIYTIGTGCLMSCGHMMFIAGDHRILFDGCECMAHQFSVGTGGKYHELEAAATSHNAFFKKQLDHYVLNSRLSAKDTKKLVLRETDTYLTSKEMLKYGYADEIIKHVRRVKIGKKTK